MGRLLGPKCRLCRREGEKLFLKGERCFGPHCSITRRNYPPGMHGPNSRGRKSEFGVRLREKQKAKRMYGVGERQFRRYFEVAASKKEESGNILLQLLERRLDNVVYRIGVAASRSQARQLVKHGHIRVNGKRVDVPSYIVRQKDVITVREGSAKKTYFTTLAKKTSKSSAPSWISFDAKKMSAVIQHIPDAQEIDHHIDTRLIIEFYSR